MEKLNVLLITNYSAVRQGIQAQLKIEEDINLMGDCETGYQALQLAGQSGPEVIIWDAGATPLQAIPAIRQFKKHAPRSNILVLVAHMKAEIIRQIMEAGATGCLVKYADATDLARAIREVGSGKVFYGPSISKKIAVHGGARAAHDGEFSSKNHPLSPFEVEILRSIAECHSAAEMAAKLFLSLPAFTKYREHVMHKLALENVASATRYAISEGIVKTAPYYRFDPSAFSPADFAQLLSQPTVVTAA